MMRSKEHPSKSGEANIATVASAVHWAHGKGLEVDPSH